MEDHNCYQGNILQEIKEDVKAIRKELHSFKAETYQRVVRLEERQKIFSAFFGFVGGVVSAIILFFIQQGGK